MACIYKQEIRLILKGVEFKNDIIKDDSNPRVYIELGNITSSIESITIGPKVEKAEEWAAVFNYNLKEKGYKSDIHISMLPFK